jgi:hypothetical protein
MEMRKVMKQGPTPMPWLYSRLNRLVLCLFAVQPHPNLVIRDEVPGDAIAGREAVLHFLFEERRVDAPGDFVHGNATFLGSGAFDFGFDFDFRVEGDVCYLVTVRERHEDVRAVPRGDVER